MDIEDIIIAIVIYKSSLQETEAYKSLSKILDSSAKSALALVYNNSPDYTHQFKNSCKNLEIVYVEDKQNSGVSQAYNTAYELAVKHHKKFILLLDQDTKVPLNYFDVFFKELKRNNLYKKDLFCPKVYDNEILISPAKKFFFTARKLSSISSGLHNLQKLAIINSGLIISTKIFEQVGGYNNNIKLDFSDVDFLKRCVQFTNQISVLDTVCNHSLSSESIQTQQMALNRFTYYIDGVRHLNKTVFESILMVPWVAFRSIKLDLKYKTFKFTIKMFN